MSAVFEIHIIYKNNLVYSEITSACKNSNLDFLVNSIEIMDDWEYNNYQILKTDQIKICEALVSQNKIVIMQGVLKSLYRFGISFWKIEKEKFVFDFWISTKNIEILDSSYITKNNIHVYNLATEFVTSVLNKKNLILCAIGSEILISDKNNDENIVNTSKNICEWIFPVEKLYNSLDRYEKNFLNGFVIYYLYD